MREGGTIAAFAGHHTTDRAEVHARAGRPDIGLRTSTVKARSQIGDLLQLPVAATGYHDLLKQMLMLWGTATGPVATWLGGRIDVQVGSAPVLATRTGTSATR